MKELCVSLEELIRPYRTISIIGMAKNAGKTTTLNYLIEAFRRENIQLGLTSIGRDGETVDIVTNTDKPRIFVHQGTIIATAENLLHHCDITKEIIMSTEINTPFGRVVAVRALSGGFVQLGGPSMTAQLAGLLQKIPADKILVDGAVGRKTLASPSVTEAAILCTGASYSRSMSKTIEETRHTVTLLTLPKFEDAAILEKLKREKPVPGYVFKRGAVTDAWAKDFVNPSSDPTVIIAEDPSKIFIKPNTYEKLQVKKAELAVLNPIRLVGLTVNPLSPYHVGYNPQIFLEKMKEAVQLPVYDILMDFNAKERFHE